MGLRRKAATRPDSFARKLSKRASKPSGPGGARVPGPSRADSWATTLNLRAPHLRDLVARRAEPVLLVSVELSTMI